MLGIAFSLLLFHSSLARANPWTCGPVLNREGCSFQTCLAPPTASYPRPTLVLKPAHSAAPFPVRVHFHGWTQDEGVARNPDYDFSWPDPSNNPDLKKTAIFWQSYALQKGACSPNPEIVLIPLSRGHNDDHLLWFRTPKAFQSYLEEILPGFGKNQAPTEELHLSAHSGGGKILASIIDAEDSRVTRIKMLDAIYSKETASKVQTWLLHPHSGIRVLELFTVTPETYASTRSVKIPGKPVGNMTERVLWTRNEKATLRLEWAPEGMISHYEIVEKRFADEGWFFE